MNPVNMTAATIARTETVPPSHSATRSTFFCDEAKRSSHAANGLSCFMSHPLRSHATSQRIDFISGWRPILRERARRPVSRWANQATARRNRCSSATTRNGLAISCWNARCRHCQRYAPPVRKFWKSRAYAQSLGSGSFSISGRVEYAMRFSNRLRAGSGISRSRTYEMSSLM
jgi:hypothetical protein